MGKKQKVTVMKGPTLEEASLEVAAEEYTAQEAAMARDAVPAEADMQADAPVTGPQADCPTYTLRADKPWQLLGLIVVWNHLAGHPLGVPAEDRPALEAAVRAFEKWEEAHR